MRLIPRAARLTLCALLLGGTARAQVDVDGGVHRPSGVLDLLEQALDDPSPARSDEVPPAPDWKSIDPDGNRRRKLYDSEFEWRQKAMDHRQRTFEWQLFASKLVFWVVVLIVALGLYFSSVQFRADRKVPQKAKGVDGGTDVQAQPAPVVPAAPPANHQFAFELGPVKLSATSPVLGVILLTISIVFFYLYLSVVYPIREV